MAFDRVVHFGFPPEVQQAIAVLSTFGGHTSTMLAIVVLSRNASVRLPQRPFDAGIGW
jgi:hypothetical protein